MLYRFIFSRNLPTVVAFRRLRKHVHCSAYLSVAALFAAPSIATAFDNDMLDEVIVTARRVESKVEETPQKVEIITREDIEKTVAVDLTDVLKKNAGVDVIQYNGVLSGIGIRGFRPEFSGTNKRSLLLIDGRPAGSTNLATILLDNVERIEILKGPASALYGSSAMGGVVNIITRRSRGDLKGEARVGYGSFDTRDLGARAGGNLTEAIDFDLNASYHNQADDYRMGSGDIRPYTAFRTQNVNGRLGADFADHWRIDGKFDVFQGCDILTPGDIADGSTNQGSKDVDRAAGDIRLSRKFQTHTLSLTAYTAQEKNDYRRVTSTNPLDQPYLPYNYYDNQIDWYGVQVQNDWQWSDAHNLVIGIDWERVDTETRSLSRTGQQQAPFYPDNRKETLGLYAENTFRFNDGNTILTLGGRYDSIETTTLQTPFLTNFTPSSTESNIFNPSIGAKQVLWPGVRLHASAGRAFVTPEAAQLTGYSETIRGGQPQITQGNPDLKPERSISWDMGIEYADERSRLDVTYFWTKVEDRIISNVVISKPPPPAPVIVTYANGNEARIQGLEIEGSWRVADPWTLFANITYYFQREETLGGVTSDIKNVPKETIRAGVDYAEGPWSGRLQARYVGERFDNDFTVAGIPTIAYPTFTVADVNINYRFAKAHRVSLDVNNLFDRDYYEKKGYNLAGRSLLLGYRYEF